MFKKKIEFGNYTLIFGKDKVLLDYLLEIVMPSFTEMKYTKSFKGTEYFFLDTELVILEDAKEPTLAIKGRIIKNTKIKRHQIFENGGIVDDKKELESAPSSSFLLVLNNHRIIFTKDVPSAPSLKNLETVSKSFLTKRYNEYINEIHKKQKKNTPKKIIEIENPKPELRITPLTDNESLNNFVLRFERINNVTIKLLTTNSEEIDNDDFWNALDKSKIDMKSVSVKVEYTNTDTGLNKKEVLSQTESASSMGNSEIRMKGIDYEGDSIIGNNDDFSLTVDIKSQTADIENIYKIQYNEFERLSKEDVIDIPVTKASILTTIINFISFLK